MKHRRINRFSLPFGLMPVLMFAAGPAWAGELDLIVTDETGRPLPCRVLIRPHGGACVVPDGAVDLPIGPDRWFMSSGHSKAVVPPGKVLLRVERGLEYVRVKKEVDVSETTAMETVTLTRWVNMKQRGYLCGENHIHQDSVSLAPMLVAEGLDFGSSLTWWNGPDARRPVPRGEGPVRNLTFAGHSVPTSIYDAELEYAWGAAYLQYLPAPLPLEADRQRPNLDYVRHAVESGGIVHYQGGWSRESLLDALLGYVHTVNICNNNFALHRFQPRSRYSNLLDVEGFPIYPDTDEGMLRMNTETYYRLLNCGLQLAAGAGTASGVKQAPVGYNRAYVRVPSTAALAEFNHAWKAGRNFVTNGPMLFLKILRAPDSGNDDSTIAVSLPGDTIDFPAGGGRLQASVEAICDQTLTSVEIIANGRLIASLDVKNPRHVSGTVPIDIKESAWIAARCTAHDDLLSDDELAVYSHGSDDAPFRIRPSRLRFAHTSPVYVRAGGRDAAVPASIHEGLTMLDRFETFAQQTANRPNHVSIGAAIEKARETMQAHLQPQ